MQSNDPKRQWSSVLRYSLYLVTAVSALYLVEILAMLSRFKPMPHNLPGRVFAVHGAIFLGFWCLGLPLLLSSRIRQVIASWWWLCLVALLVATSGGGGLYGTPLVVGGLVAGGGSWLLVRSRLYPRAISTLGLFFTVITASQLAKGSLLEKGGWETLGWTFGWLILSLVVLKLTESWARPYWRHTWIVILILLILSPFASSLGSLSPKPALAPGPTGSGPIIVLIVLDTVRADVFTPSFSAQPIMPRLDAFARQHLTRLSMTAPAPSSLPSHATLFTGIPAIGHGAHAPWADDPNPPVYAYALDSEFETLAERLRRQGYRTAAVSGNYGPLSPRFGLAQGFEVYDAVRNESARFVSKMLVQRCILLRRLMEQLPFPLFGYESSTPYRPAEVIVDGAIKLLHDATQPLFLFVNIFDVHSPYLPPQYWKLRTTLPGSEWIKNGEPLPDDYQAITNGRRSLTSDEAAYLKTLYKSELLYVDEHLDRLLSALDLSNTLLIMLSDHGESLGEHSLLKHSQSVYQEQVAVPCFLGFPKGDEFAHLRSLPEPHDFLEIHDLILTAAGLTPPERQRPEGVLTEVYDAGHPVVTPDGRVLWRGEIRAWLSGSLKLVDLTRGRYQLFAVREGIVETDDLAADQPETVAALAAELDRYLLLFPAKYRPTEDSALSDSDREALHTLGYIE